MTNDDHSEPGPDASIDELEADLQHTREQLGETIDAIGAKLDVKSQMKDTVHHARANAADSAAHAKQVVTDTVGGFAESDAADTLRGQDWPKLAALGGVALVGVILWRRNR